jgi:hypothetical protein
MKLRCNACGATYVDVQDDGVRYFHACGPLSPAELEAAIADGTVTLTDAQQAQLGPLDVDTPATDGSPSAPPQPTPIFARLTVERPNKRDENVVVVGKDEHGTAIVAVKLEGAGVTELG